MEKSQPYVFRQIESTCRRDLESFPVLTITGPRQSGKSTLLKYLLPDWTYVSLEEPSNLDFAHDDPLGFMAKYNDRVILDEIQRVPNLLSQIQVEVDKDRRPGRFAISGSNNLLLMESVSQSLAGRTAIRHLLPFSYYELMQADRAEAKLEETLFVGGYPTINLHPHSATSWLDSYIQTYVEKDVRLIKNITSLETFRRFLLLCAGRAGLILDQSSLGGDVGVSHNTIRDWINVLEAGFIAFRLSPFYNNFAKRLIKSPKLYFYDTALLCRLMNIRSENDLINHPFRGNIFENWCVLESMKAFHNRGQRPTVYYWKDKQFEVDLVVEKSSTSLMAVECKSAATLNASFLEPTLKFKKIAKYVQVEPAVVYGGLESQNRSLGQYFSWMDFSRQLNNA